MNQTTKQILRQLENEGISYQRTFGLHWLGARKRGAMNFLGTDVDLGIAVHRALKRSLQITWLLGKLQDAVLADMAQGGKT